MDVASYCLLHCSEALQRLWYRSLWDLKMSRICERRMHRISCRFWSQRWRLVQESREQYFAHLYRDAEERRTKQNAQREVLPDECTFSPRVLNYTPSPSRPMSAERPKSASERSTLILAGVLMIAQWRANQIASCKMPTYLYLLSLLM